LKANDKKKYADAAFEVIHEVLNERGERLPIELSSNDSVVDQPKGDTNVTNNQRTHIKGRRIGKALMWLGVATMGLGAVMVVNAFSIPPGRRDGLNMALMQADLISAHWDGRTTNLVAAVIIACLGGVLFFIGKSLD
jgi:hypothetical protein